MMMMITSIKFLFPYQNQVSEDLSSNLSNAQHPSMSLLDVNYQDQLKKFKRTLSLCQALGIYKKLEMLKELKLKLLHNLRKHVSHNLVSNHLLMKTTNLMKAKIALRLFQTIQPSSLCLMRLTLKTLKKARN